MLTDRSYYSSENDSVSDDKKLPERFSASRYRFSSFGENTEFFCCSPPCHLISNQLNHPTNLSHSITFPSSLASIRFTTRLTRFDTCNNKSRRTRIDVRRSNRIFRSDGKSAHSRSFAAEIRSAIAGRTAPLSPFAFRRRIAPGLIRTDRSISQAISIRRLCSRSRLAIHCEI